MIFSSSDSWPVNYQLITIHEHAQKRLLRTKACMSQLCFTLNNLSGAWEALYY